MLPHAGPKQAQSPTETSSCRPLIQRPRGGSKHVSGGSADTRLWTSSHPDSNSTTTTPFHTTAEQVSPIVILLVNSHIYEWKLTTFVWLLSRPLPRLPQPFYDHWHMDTIALGEFHQHLNTLFFALWKLCRTKWPPCRNSMEGLTEKRADRTPWCCASSIKVFVCPRSGTAELFKMYIYC